VNALKGRLAPTIIPDMMPHFTFLFALLLQAVPLTAQLPDTKPVPRVQIIPLPDYQASFQLEGKELTRFHFDPKAKRPFWYPVLTSPGPSLVRIGHPHDPIGHRHHYGVWITHAAVSGVNFWDDETDNGKDRVRGSIVHQRVLGYWDGDESASMMTLNHWIADRDGRVLLVEKRRSELLPLDGAKSWMLIVDSEFTAPKGQTATFEPSGFGLLSARMAKTIGVNDGGGRILNSEGQINEKNVFHKPAKWCDYSGRLTNDADGLGGITLMNHPANPNHPTAFHVRDDGWMCDCLSLEKPVEVGDTQPLHVRWALWVHEGVPDEQLCETMWKKFAGLPPAEMNRKP
jgi:methane monooxygenase PmoA-like